MQDPELEAMAAVFATLDRLDPEMRKRVLDWALSRFRTSEGSNLQTSTPGEASVFRYVTFAELFEAASPKLEKDKALVACYWLQSTQGVEQFGSEPVNSELKHVGHGLKNVTDCLSRLMDEKPQLILQVRKSGTSRQSRKTYKLTTAGLRKVESMVKSSS